MSVVTINNRGYTYLLESNGLYKIGMSIRTPQHRIKEFQTGNPHKIVVHGYSFNNNCLNMEQILHNKFASKRLMGEWFALSDNDISYIHNYFESDNIDEFYAPLSVEYIKQEEIETLEDIKNEKWKKEFNQRVLVIQNRKKLQNNIKNISISIAIIVFSILIAKV